MFQLLSKHSFSLVRTYADRVFLGFRTSDGERHLYPYSLDGELGEELKFSKKGLIVGSVCVVAFGLSSTREPLKRIPIYIRLEENGSRPSLICTQIYIS